MYILFPLYVSAFITAGQVEHLRDLRRISSVSATNKTLSGLFFPPEVSDPGPLERVAVYMGYEPKEKWKAIRYTAYALAAGYMMSETVNDFFRSFF